MRLLYLMLVEDSSLNKLEADHCIQGLRVLARIIARKRLRNVRLETDRNRKDESSKKLDRA